MKLLLQNLNADTTGRGWDGGWLKAYFAPPLIQADWYQSPGRLACPGSRLHRGPLGLPRSCKAEVDGLSTLGRSLLHVMSVCVDADVWHQKPEVEAWPPSGSL